MVTLIVLTSFKLVNSPVVVIDLPKSNVLYKGVHNPISISMVGASDDDLIVAVVGGDYVEIRPGEHAIIVHNEVRQVVIRVAYKSENDEVKMMGSEVFRAERLPVAEAVLGGIYNDGKSLRKEVVGRQTGVFTQYNLPTLPEIHTKVLGYEAVVVDGDVTQTFINKGSAFSPELKEAISDLNSGSYLGIYNVRYTDLNTLDSASKQATNLLITIK